MQTILIVMYGRCPTQVLTIHVGMGFFIFVVLGTAAVIQGLFHYHTVNVEGLAYDVSTY